MTNPDGTANGIIRDNFAVISDIAWYGNAYVGDGFYVKDDRCIQNPESILFCNIFETAINYIKKQSVNIFL